MNFTTEVHKKVSIDCNAITRGIRQIIASRDPKDKPDSLNLFDCWYFYQKLIKEALKGDDRAALESGSYALHIASEETKKEIGEELLKSLIAVAPCDSSLVMAYEMYPDFKAEYLTMLQLNYLENSKACTMRRDELAEFSKSIEQGESGPVQIF